MRNILILLFVLSFISCSDDDRLGFETSNEQSFFVINFTDNEYSGATIYIGALVEDKFYPTDSIITTERIAPSEESGRINNAGQQFSSIDLPLWYPNFDKISAISNKGTFYLKLSDGTSIKYSSDFNFPNPVVDGVKGFYISDEDLSK